MTETDLKELQIDVLNQKIEKIGDEVKKHERSSKISNAFCIIFLVLMAFSVSNFINALLLVFAALKSAANNEAKKAKDKQSELDALESKLNAL